MGKGVRGDPCDGLPQHLSLVVDTLDGEEDLAGNSVKAQGEEDHGRSLSPILALPIIRFIMGVPQTARQDSSPHMKLLAQLALCPPGAQVPCLHTPHTPPGAGKVSAPSLPAAPTLRREREAMT